MPPDTVTPAPSPSTSEDDGGVVHRFDTEHRDLERGGYVLELHEQQERLLVIVSKPDGSARVNAPEQLAQVRIDSSWALEILAGTMSPLAALEQRSGRPASAVVQGARALVGARKLRRVDSRAVGPVATPDRGEAASRLSSVAPPATPQVDRALPALVARAAR
jgi:hypothetical protein